MAFVTVEDCYGSIECVAFPAVYERIKSAVANDKIVTLKGKIEIDEAKGPTIILDDLKEFNVDEYNQKVNPKPVTESVQKKRQPILWLNATELSDEDFDDMVNMLSNYEGNLTCAIVRGGSRFKLQFGVNYCRGLLAELGAYIQEKDIKMVE
jgi:DNA polymerase III alpha subunit